MKSTSNHQKNIVIFRILHEIYPDLFSRQEIIPLAVGIKQQILNDPKFQQETKNLKGVKAALDNVLRAYTQNKRYCRSLVTVKERVDIAGNKTPIKEKYIKDAKARLNGEKPFRIKRLIFKKVNKPKVCKLKGVLTKNGIILSQMPAEVWRLPNKWIVFFIEINGDVIRVKLRPKFFKKLQDVLLEHKKALVSGFLNKNKTQLKPFNVNITVRRLQTFRLRM